MALSASRNSRYFLSAADADAEAADEAEALGRREACLLQRNQNEGPVSTPSEIFGKKSSSTHRASCVHCAVLCNVPHVPFCRHYALLVHRILVFLFLVVLFLVEGAAEEGAAPGRGGGRGGGAAGAEAAVVVPEAAARSAAVAAAAARRSASAAEAAAVLLLRLSVLLTVVSAES